MKDIKYPNITVQLSGTDGNVFALIGRVKSALVTAKVPPEEVKAFTAEAFSQCSYDHVIQLLIRTVEVE